MCRLFFFFNDTATTEIYTLSLHDALPIYETIRRVDTVELRARDFPRQLPLRLLVLELHGGRRIYEVARRDPPARSDRKSTRLNSSHANISYAVFCLKKKNQRLVQLQ